MSTATDRRAIPIPAVARRPRHVLWNGHRVPLQGDDRPLIHLAKRALDLVLTSLLLLVLLPLLVAIAIAIKASSEGPVLFRQTRWGSRRRVEEDGTVTWEARSFRCAKFRTMVHRADESVHAGYVRAFVRGEIADRDGLRVFKLVGDSRVTRVGALLRRTSLDELPQFLNVLRGEMSLVGPRPVPLYEVESYPGEWCMGRLGALPGITGPWQTRARCTVPFEEMIRLDLDYVAHVSIGRDLGLMLRTLPAVLTRRGAG
jgi:lipopolysaccharide/colanic/teichoic acid biosynthesis glycosyltransferase